jgi:hypothetical protein
MPGYSGIWSVHDHALKETRDEGRIAEVAEH